MALDREIAKEAVAQLADKATAFLEKLVGPPMEEIGQLLADKVRFWRFRNQVNILGKAEKYLAQMGLSPRPVPLKTLIPLLEESSWEEDNVLQDKWASLLASAADPASREAPFASYVEILKQISPKEAGLLDAAFDSYSATPYPEREAAMFSRDAVAEEVNIEPEQIDLLLDNLFRLNLIQPPASHGGVSIGNYPIVLRTHELFQLTTLGIDFVERCRYGKR